MTAVVLAALNLMGLAFVYAQDPATVKLESPYYVFPRTGGQHIDMSSGWELTSNDTPLDELSGLNGKE